MSDDWWSWEALEAEHERNVEALLRYREQQELGEPPPSLLDIQMADEEGWVSELDEDYPLPADDEEEEQ